MPIFSGVPFINVSPQSTASDGRTQAALARGLNRGQQNRQFKQGLAEQKRQFNAGENVRKAQINADQAKLNGLENEAREGVIISEWLKAGAANSEVFNTLPDGVTSVKNLKVISDIQVSKIESSLGLKGKQTQVQIAKRMEKLTPEAFTQAVNERDQNKMSPKFFEILESGQQPEDTSTKVSPEKLRITELSELLRTDQNLSPEDREAIRLRISNLRATGKDVIEPETSTLPDVAKQIKFFRDEARALENRVTALSSEEQERLTRLRGKLAELEGPKPESDDRPPAVKSAQALSELIEKRNAALNVTPFTDEQAGIVAKLGRQVKNLREVMGVGGQQSVSTIKQLADDYNAETNPETKAFILADIRKKITPTGMQFEISPDGKIVFAQGAGVGGDLTNPNLTMIQNREINIKSATKLIDTILATLKPSDVGVRGEVGELLLDGWLQQFGFNTIDWGRTERRKALGDLFQKMVPLMTSETRFTEGDISRIRKATFNIDAKTSFGQVVESLLRVKDIIGDATIRNAVLLGKVDELNKDQISKAVELNELTKEQAVEWWHRNNPVKTP